MKTFKVFLYYFEGYFFNLPAYLIHELSHWLVAFFWWLILFKWIYYDMPTIHIDEIYKIKIDDKYTSISNWSMFVSCNFTMNVERFTMVIAPAISTILILFFTIYFGYYTLFIYFSSRVATLWLSLDDTEKLQNIIKGEPID
jgi:hypothetical protein